MLDQPLASLRKLRVEFQTKDGPVLGVEDVSFDVNPGETVCIVGESGSGKSVSSLSLMRLVEFGGGQIAGGELLFNRGEGGVIDVAQAGDDVMRTIRGNEIGMIFQEPMTSLNPVFTVGRQLTEGLRVHKGMSKEQATERALDLLRQVRIPEPERRLAQYPHELSGGMRQRVVIAMALACEPKLLIADEPTTALDVTVQAQVLSLLEELQAETGMGLLLITHDLGVVAEVADRVVVMNSGEIVETGDAATVYHTPKHPYTEKLIAAVPGTGEMAQPLDTGIAPILEINGLTKHFGGFVALEDASLTVLPGETVAIVGESGSGKSTLAKTLLRLEDATSGEVLYGGRDLVTMSAGELFGLRRDIQMVFQDPTQSLNPRMSVYDIISEAFVIHPEILAKDRW